MVRTSRKASGGLRLQPEEKQRWTSADARAALDAWREQGGTLAAFCRARGIHPERMRRWQRRLAMPSAKTGARLARSSASTPCRVDKAPADGWVEAMITGATAGSSAVVVQLRGGDRIEVACPTRVDAGWLARLVAGLAERR
jgi:hypothetical protein